MKGEPTTTEVMKLELESDRDDSAVDVIIKMKRHPGRVMYVGSPPDVDDLPLDFRMALESWLKG